MKVRLNRRVFAAVLAAFLVSAPVFTFAAPRNRPKPRDPRERIVRIIGQIRNALLPVAHNDGMTPPKP